MDSIAELFDFTKLSRAPARFDENELRHVNAKLLHELDFSAIQDRFDKLLDGAGEDFWLAVRGNIEVFDDVEEWWRIVSYKIEPKIDDEKFCELARELLPAPPFDENTWSTWTNAVKKKTGAKGKALFMPLRKALTGLEHGPELKALLPLMSHDKVSARLEGKTA